MVETNATCQNFKLYAVMIPEWRKIWQVPWPIDQRVCVIGNRIGLIFSWFLYVDKETRIS